MGKPAGTHQPLRWYDKLRLNAAKKHLHSKFHSVRQAALKEIQAILAKKRGLQNRLRKWLRSARNAAVRKVTPSQLHKPLRVQKQAPQQTRGRAADIPAGQWRKFTPLTDHSLTRAELKERAKADRQAQRSGQQPPLVRPREVPLRQGQHEPVTPAHLTDDAIQQRWQGAWNDGVREGRERAQQQPPRQPDAMQQATGTMRRAHEEQAEHQRQSADSWERKAEAARQQKREWVAQHGDGPYAASLQRNIDRAEQNREAARGREQQHAEQAQPARETEGQRAVREMNDTFAKNYPDVKPMPERQQQSHAGAPPQDKKPWTGLDKHLAAPAEERTADTRLPSERVGDARPSRSRTRNPA